MIFTPDDGDLTARAVGAATAVARLHGVVATDPVVVRDRSNVLVHLRPAPVIARIATTTALVRAGGAFDWLDRDVRVARFLDAGGAPVVPPATELPPGPHRHDGLAVTFWRFVDHDPARPSDRADVGRALRELHEALAGCPVELPRLAAVLNEVRRILDGFEAAGRLDADDLARLRDHADCLEPLVTDPALAVQPLHGDAHAGNLLRTSGGLLWTDFEDTCVGPRAWDLACMAAVAPLGGADELDAYGDDATDLAPFVEARELQLTAWTVLMAERYPELEERARARLAGWRR